MIANDPSPDDANDASSSKIPDMTSSTEPDAATPDDSRSPHSPTSARPEWAPGIPGWWIVFAMFTFAITIIVLLFLYWELYTRPFREVQVAIAEAFPKSQPQVVGGKHKSHRPDAKSEMRIVIQVANDPRTDDKQSAQIALRLARIAAEHHDLSAYDLLDIILVHRVPERDPQVWSRSLPVAEWRDLPAEAAPLAPSQDPAAPAAPM